MLRLGPKGLFWGGLLIGMTIFCLLFPPIRIVSLEAVQESKEREAFHPDAFVQSLIDQELPRALKKAADIQAVLEPATRQLHARKWGIGDSIYFLVSGSARVRAIEGDEVHARLAGEEDGFEVVLVTDHIFGNVLRNSLGLVNPSDFPNSQDLNSISIALNKRISREVLAPFREEVSPGALIRFVACTELSTDAKSLESLKVIPVQISVE